MEAEEKKPTLGQRLHSQSLFREDKKWSVKIEAARTEIRQFFQSVREEAEAAVAEWREIEYVQIPARFPFIMEGKPPNDFLHYCHEIFLEFFEWGKANDLELVMMRNEDRQAGFQTWYLVRYECRFGESKIIPATEPVLVPNNFRPPRKPVPQAKTKTKKV